MSRLRILALEPYYGGSHRAVLDSLIGAIDADWTLLTLPARKWKWRMRGAAITMAAEARRIAEAHVDTVPPRTESTKVCPPFDLVFASTFVNLAEFRGLAGSTISAIPAIVYFHENQLVYPNRHTSEWDFQFPLTNITSALSAQACLFNSLWNLEQFVAEIPGFMREFPDHHPKGIAERVAAKSRVLAPPFDPAEFDAAPPSRAERPRIVWPHRWEHDKNPEEFLSAAARLASEGLDFEVAVGGQAFRDVPQSIADAEAVLGGRLVHATQPKTRADYAGLLASSDIAVSTANNEFFGIAMVEAAYAGCFPLVPDRLAYPELYPSEMRYRGPVDLVEKLRTLVLRRPTPGQASRLAERFTTAALAPAYDAEFHRVASMV